MPKATPRSERVRTRLKEIRTRRGLSQRELADTVRMTPQALTRYETGRSNMSLGALCRICDALQCTTDEILGREKR